MQRKDRLAALTVVISIAAFYGWMITFQDNDWLRAIGVCVLRLAIGAFSLYGIAAAYRSKRGQPRSFWLLLGIGYLIYFGANSYMLYDQLVRQYAYVSFLVLVVLLSAYVFYLAGLIVKLKEIIAKAQLAPYLFNITVFIVAVSAISVQYLIYPVMSHTDEVVGQIAPTFWFEIYLGAFPILSLSIFFVTIMLHYLILNKRHMHALRYITIAFFVQFGADSIITFLNLYGAYRVGSFTDLLWQTSMLFVGFGALYARKAMAEPRPEPKRAEKRNITVFPYIAIMFLLVVVLVEYAGEMNPLSFGLITIFFLAVGRQFKTSISNERLIREYHYLAYHDSLTGIHNRTKFKLDIGDAIEQSRVYGRELALLLIDLDKFKTVNDTLGHQTGDSVISQAAERIQRCAGFDVPLYRLSGDEFVIILADSSERQCEELSNAMLEGFHAPIRVRGHEIHISLSIGISLYPRDGESHGDLLKHADSAMYLSKHTGRNRYEFYSAASDEQMNRKIILENELRRAIERDQLELYYQPKVELASRRIVGMEALVRWNHPELGSVSPAEFIPIAEDSNLIVSIGEWVLRAACRQNQYWQDAGYAPLCVSVNVSARQFQYGSFDQTVTMALQDTGMKPQYLELELTESILQDVQAVADVLTPLRKIGVRTSIDDFGKGYSSLYILQTLPIDAVKIDKLFIDAIENHPGPSMLKTMIDLGRNLNLSVIAEGIEEERQLQVLIDNQCHIGQGYLFSKPLPAAEFEGKLSFAAARPSALYGT